MNSRKIETVLLRYPYLGEVCRATSRGFGFINTHTSVEFIHLRDHYGRNLDTMLGLDGKPCAYVIGGHPFRYSKKKPGWDRAVVEWQLLDDIDIPALPEAYKEARGNALSDLDKERLHSVLSAEWYDRLWRKKTNGGPKAILRPDQLLEDFLHLRLASSSDTEELIHLLASICRSPWYATQDSEKTAVCDRFYQPSDWPTTVFLAHKPLQSCRGYAEIGPLCGTDLEVHVRKAKTVALDLESNGDTISEFGWKNVAGTDVRRDANGLSQTQLLEAVRECLYGQSDPCIVGHNLLNWDLPILQQHKISFPENSALWDTLIASWLLEPWQVIHALVVEKDAHTADADAAACYDLFEDQIARLNACLDGQPHDIRSLVDRLYEDPGLFEEIEGRNYPHDLQDSLSRATVYPLCKMNEFAWQRNCQLQLVATESKLADPLLSPDCCRNVAEKERTISAKAVAAIVADAFLENVEVRLSYLPPWLVDGPLKESLKEAHAECDGADSASDGAVIYLAEDLFKLSRDDINNRFADGSCFSVAYPGDVAVIWQQAQHQKLTEAEVHHRFPKAAEGRVGRVLIPVADTDGEAVWLLHAPSGLNAFSSSWALLPPMPSWLKVESDPTQGVTDSFAWIPRWREGDASRLDIDRLFVSPDTANRPLYLADLTHCLLNLLRSHSADEVLVLGVRWPEEVAQLQRNLVQLGVSAEHPGTPLRQLESICQKSMRILVCARDELPKFIQGAARLGRKIQVILDEVPLHHWYAILNAPTAPQRTDEHSDIPDAASEDDESDEQTDSDRQDHAGTQVLLRGSDIRSVTNRFLHGWLQGMGIPPPAEAPACLILDPRLADHHAAKATQIPRWDVPFYSLEELIDEDKLQIFYNICYPKRQEQDIPNDYETYRAFLKENWDYDDFRPGSQRPAIEKLIQTSHDILLRLPTGAGKSIVFHLPALLRSHYSGRLTVVITPLRALMRDQAEGLWQKRFTESVDFLSGGRDAWVNHEVYQGVLDGRIRLVFVAPERFRVPRFTEALERRRRMDGGLEFVVFDETHCISEWGFEFRPDYLHAAQYVAEWFKIRELPGNPHRLLLTSATVTQRNKADLEVELGLGQVGDYDDLPEDMPHPIQPYIELESFDLHEDENAPSDEKFEKTCELLGKLNLDNSAALVFVRRRKDCHRISEALNSLATVQYSGLPSLHALPFHAGLPESVKTEACNLLLNKNANVLVCTKAFGMGMDIPHLHACVHHRPPTFIEDYLQEVGRIGRDEEKRARAGHDRVTATLLYNQDNIERNLGLLHDKTVMPPDLQDFFGYCIAKGVLFEGVGKSLCIVPAKVRISETKEFDDNQVTNCLFWLERMGVLRIEGRHPPFLDLSLDLPGLRNHAEGSSLASRIATLLLSLVTESNSVVKELASTSTQDVSQPQTETVFGRVIKGLLRGVLALISPSEEVEPQPRVPVTRTTYSRSSMDGELDVSLSMSELMSGCGGISMDDLFVGLFELSKAGVLSVRKSFVVLRNGAPSSDEFFDLLEVAVERLLKPTDGKVEFLERKQFESELRARYRKILFPESQEEGAADGGVDISRLLTRRIQREVYRAISTSLRILRYAGVEIRESLSESGVAQYARTISESLQSTVAISANQSIRAMRQLLDCVSSAEDRSNQAQGATFEIPLIDIIDTLGGDVRMGRLKELMKLLESAGFYGFEGGLSDWVSLVTLNTQEPLPTNAPDSDEGTAVQRVYTEMLEKYEIQVLRAQAMVLLAAMPAENRKEYIDRYFQCVKAEDLEGLLEDTVGDVDDEVLASNPMLQGLLSQVRRERFSEEFEKLNDNQLAVCKTPFDHTLLVNAGPGSGKTHVLRMRCAHLIHMQRIAPAEILVLAFNRAVVYEIRDRIRILFRALGYGSYANRLDVSTFHSFALRHQQAKELYEEDAIEQAIHIFAEAMESDSDFARAVGGRYKAVLVDEFQDMNEDFYSVVKVLLSNCGGGKYFTGM